MKRSDPQVRKRCREVYGSEWYTVDKKKRQEEAMKYLDDRVKVDSVSEENKLRALIGKTLQNHKILSIKKLRLRPCARAMMR